MQNLISFLLDYNFLDFWKSIVPIYLNSLKQIWAELLHYYISNFIKMGGKFVNKGSKTS